MQINKYFFNPVYILYNMYDKTVEIKIIEYMVFELFTVKRLIK